MASSTSHSKRRVPLLVRRLAVAALVTWGMAAAYTLYLSPETRFWKAAAQRKQQWAEKLTREQKSKVLVVGGSSCAFSIDGARLLTRESMPTVNMGLGAGTGAKLLSEWALSQTRPGDTLVVAMEPALLTSDLEPTAFAIQFSYAMGSPRWIRGVLEPHFPVGPGSLLALRPGGYHVATLLGKLVQGRPLFRYAVSDIQQDGLIETAVRREEGVPGHDVHLSAGGRTLLASLRDWSRTNNVRVCYSLPWAWSSMEESVAFRQRNATFLLEVAEYLPVLEDRSMGARTERDLFADTSWHLNQRGSALRSDGLAQQLRDWRMWKPADLKAIATGGLAPP